MSLLKIEDGLLEVDNFYLTSSFDDFAGNSLVNRDINNGTLKLISNNLIERKFNYNEFVIDFQKQNFNNMNVGDYSMMYLGDKTCTFGIKDEKKTEKTDEQNEYWRILKRDNYIQAYASNNGLDYTNIGGMKFDTKLTKQGFQKYCDEDFILQNYKIYKSPYVTIINFDENYTCEMYDNFNNLIKTRAFDSNMECRLFIDTIFIGYIIVKDLKGNVVYKSNLIKFSFGDVYINSPYNFEIKYNNKIVTNEEYGILKSYKEVIEIKNKDTIDYTNIKISTDTTSNDLIELSFNDINYSKELEINTFKTQEIKQVYIKITKQNLNNNHYVRNFQLLVC